MTLRVDLASMRAFAPLVAMLLLAGCFGSDDPVVPAATDAPEVPPTAQPGTEPTPDASTSPPSPSSSNRPATPADAQAAPDATTVPPAPRIEVTGWNSTITGAGASMTVGPVCCVWPVTQGETSVEFAVSEGLKGIVIELVWTDATTDLDLQVLGGDYVEKIPPEPNGTATTFHEGHTWLAAQGAPGSPDAHATIVVTDPDALVSGTWVWRVGANGPAKDVPFSVFVSLFLDEAPGEGYSAAAPSSNP